MRRPRPLQRSLTRVAMLVTAALAGYCLACRRAQRHANGARYDNQRLLDQASDAILSVDDTAHIIEANRAAAQMFGTTVDAMHAAPLSRYIQPPSPTASSALDYFPSGDGRAGRRATDYAVSAMRADGQLFPVEGSLSTLRQDGRTLTMVILRDVSERHLVQQRLARSHDQLRQLSAALQTIREEERTHIARELHDDLGQLLASLRMDLTLLERSDGLGEASQRLVQGMESNLLTAINSLRRIATNLRPRALDEGGLYFALQGLRDAFVERHGIACTLLADEAELRLDDSASTAIFRIIQEALTNIARHAGATTVALNLYRTNGDLLVTIRDDGRGIRAEDMEKAASLGLVGMRERVWAMQGEITISSDEPPGTRIDIVLPMHGHTV